MRHASRREIAQWALRPARCCYCVAYVCNGGIGALQRAVARDCTLCAAEACVMTRPYISLSIAQLEFLAAEDPTDSQSVRLLVDELSHRNGRRVRRLLSQLEVSSGTTQETLSEQDSDGSFVRSEESTDFGGDPAIHTYESNLQTTESYELLLRKYENLRLTFTVEAELLARWGMTPLMPPDMQELVFGEWRNRLLPGPDALGRSVESLETDQRRIADERRLLQDAQGGATWAR